MKSKRNLKLHQYIQNRYDHYDSIAGRYCGEKFTDGVFEDAMRRFKIETLEECEKMDWDGMVELNEINKGKADKIRAKKVKNQKYKYYYNSKVLYLIWNLFRKKGE